MMWCVSILRLPAALEKTFANWVGTRQSLSDKCFCISQPSAETKAIARRFREALPEWFIKLFTDEGDLVLDPFFGSGTTCAAAQRSAAAIPSALKSWLNTAKSPKEKSQLVIISYLRKEQEMPNVTVQEITNHIEQHIPDFHRRAFWKVLPASNSERFCVGRIPISIQGEVCDERPRTWSKMQFWMHTSRRKKKPVFGGFLEELGRLYLWKRCICR